MNVSPLMISSDDLSRCHRLLGPAAWRALAGKRLFITGGTGFVGKWLLATLLDADQRWNLGCTITVLSRDPRQFLQQWPHLEGRIGWVTGDVRSFPIDGPKLDVIIHAATDVVAQASPLDVFSTCLDGTRRVLELARASHAQRLLIVSSGAVYGPLPLGMTHVPESFLGAPDPLLSGSAYAEGKRAAEWLACQAAGETLAVCIARLFAAVGPHLPLDKHFAVGNFLQQAMNATDIVIEGDGTPYRSYLYAADMAAWLWAVLLRGQTCRAYNVGADESLSIQALAQRVSAIVGDGRSVTVQRARTPGRPDVHYVPDIRRAISELGLEKPLALDEALLRTARWHRTTRLAGGRAG